jgi:acyl-CoA reductase-like NAD-dependent aldehyde dehydrogenase
VQVLRVPVGVTGHIIPWNYPAQMFARSLAPSLAVGNATVIKPSEDASQSIVGLARLANECGIPAGAINVVTAFGRQTRVSRVMRTGQVFINCYGAGGGASRSKWTAVAACSVLGMHAADVQGLYFAPGSIGLMSPTSLPSGSLTIA